jgi:hypothetical protein
MLTKDIGTQLYPDKYNPKIDQYIKLIHMGKISSLEDEIIFDPVKPEETFHCVVKKIPDDAFVIEKSKLITPQEVNDLLFNPKLAELLSQRVIFEFINSYLDSPDVLNNLIAGKGISINAVTQESLVAKYSKQISVLKEMGFTDENELAILISNANGNIENVINILMS